MKTSFLLLLLLTLALGGCYYDNEEELYNCSADAATVRYSTTVTGILNANGCQGCHAGAGAPGGVELNTHAGVKTVAANGRLYGSVSHANGYVPMPMGGDKISACDLKKLKAWIDAGAPNN